MSVDDVLKMSFDPNTIEHLGVKMYSQIPSAVAELMANAYDADAENVEIKLYDNDDGKSIKVIDDGLGMSFSEVNTKFLRIGRNRRSEGAKKSPKGRIATGKKGLGKLALFGLGDIIDIETVQEGSGKRIKFTMDWLELKSTGQAEYAPKFEVEECDVSCKGTTIILKRLKRESAFDKNGLAVSLSKLFNCFSEEFRCSVSLNDDDAMQIDNTLKYESLDSQFIWEFPDFSEKLDHDYASKIYIVGEIISTEKPLSQGMRGVTLFANGRLVNMAEFFGVPESSHGFSYLTGWLNVNFIDDLDEDVISTNRQSLNWELSGTAELRKFLEASLRTIVREWSAKRKEISVKKVSEGTQIDTEKWYGTLSDEVKNSVESIVNTVIDETSAPTENQITLIGLVHKLVPEYPYYHWRHIHESIQDASLSDYENQDYYRAFLEAIKRYVNTARQNSNSTNSSDLSFMGEVFGADKDFSVTADYKKPNGNEFSSSTKENIEDGQKFLSMGIISGARNPVSHEEITDLRDSNLFSEKDCLDALSLLSHLFRRLDDGIAAKNSQTP